MLHHPPAETGPVVASGGDARGSRASRSLLEDWTLKITSVNADSTAWEFEVTGSKTGADGGGSSAKAFVSKSGRVKIEPAAWFRNGKVPVGYEIKWKVVPLFADTYQVAKIEDATREHAVTLAQGLSNGSHTLEISTDGKGIAAVRAIRVYRPPVR